MKKIKIGIVALSFLAIAQINAQESMKSKEYKSVEEIFATFDTNGDQQIDKKEFVKSVESKVQRSAEKSKEVNSAADIDAKFDKLDADKNGLIDLNEFKAVREKRAETKGAELKEKFDKIDDNENGFLDMKEYQKYVNKMIENAKEKGREPLVIDSKKSFAEMDKNADKKISFEEFQIARKEMAAKRTSQTTK